MRGSVELVSILLLSLITLSGADSDSDTDAGSALALNPFEEESFETGMQYATFGAGEFHAAEVRFGCIKGVRNVMVGHISMVQNKYPHAVPLSPYIGTDVEAVQITYNSSVVEYSELLDVFWDEGHHVNEYTGPKGLKQWASVIYCHNGYQCKQAKASKRAFSEQVGESLITEVQKNNTFSEVEHEEQKFNLRRREEVLQALWDHHPDMEREEVLLRPVATLLNSYLAGGCRRPWEEVQDDIKAFELSVDFLSTMGLEELHPDVVMVPPMGHEQEL
eukprot:CAMPEP_0197843682 /NCGR_PEP_ID=MMETSP1438-20131217/594_1 /TAXON_ID=1461541 /ORGANISM="Pterosperma sp., Strain CCMP1384" /LENGTH=275 /DNA_ID=CAMNT_0043453993 /DNA_START=177 /DNA_END=1004 /DNA_ORIENTATION=-